MANSSHATRGYTFRQLLLTICLLAAILRVGLAALPEPGHTDSADAAAAATQAPAEVIEPAVAEQTPEAESIIEVVPFNLQGHLPAPLLASILRQHRPEFTDKHADDLVGTLPPGSTQRMIVILPETDKADQPY